MITMFEEGASMISGTRDKITRFTVTEVVRHCCYSTSLFFWSHNAWYTCLQFHHVKIEGGVL